MTKNQKQLMNCDGGQTCNYFSGHRKFACSCLVGEYCQSNITDVHEYAVGLINTLYYYIMYSVGE